MNGEPNIYIPRERNQAALTDEQVEAVKVAWKFLNQGKGHKVDIDFSDAETHSSLTVYDERDGKVHIGADVYPGHGITARARMSMLACLAHECSHAVRHRKKQSRSTKLPDAFIDEAETNLEASFMIGLKRRDLIDLVEAGGEYLTLWIQFMEKGESDES